MMGIDGSVSRTVYFFTECYNAPVGLLILNYIEKMPKKTRIIKKIIIIVKNIIIGTVYAIFFPENKI